MVQLFRKVMCPVDFSEHSLAALDMAVKVAQQNNAALYLLNVVPSPAGAAGFQPVQMESYPYVERERKEQLAKLARERVPGAISCEKLVTSGDPADQVLKTARGLDIDLIVMGTHGRVGLSHLVLGSVAERVVRESRIPVMTAHSAASVRKAA
jgi:universal stress protein A